VWTVTLWLLSFVFVIGLYEVITGKMPSGQMKWYFGLNTPIKVRLAASFSILFIAIIVFTHKPHSIIQYIWLLVGFVCGLVVVSGDLLKRK
jgi:hypothetical protein